MRKAQRDIEANWKGRQLVFRRFELEEAPLQVMSVEEVADLLRVSSQTVYVLARSDKLPAVKVGREWRFMRDQLLAVLQADNSGHAAAPNDSFYLAARGGLARTDGACGISRLKSDTRLEPPDSSQID